MGLLLAVCKALSLPECFCTTHSRIPKIIPLQGNAYTYDRSVIDDIRLTRACKQGDHLITNMVEDGMQLADDLRAQGNVLSVRSTCFASIWKLNLSIQRAMKARGIPLTAAKIARDLGVTSSAGTRRATSLLQSRIIVAWHRVSRIKILNSKNKKAGQLFNT